jgi:hypothetical protein
LQLQQATQYLNMYWAVQTQEAVTQSPMALWKHSYTSVCHALIPQWRADVWCRSISFSISPCIVQEVADATLCVESARPGARVTVFNATNDVLQTADADAAATTFASLAPGR